MLMLAIYFSSHPNVIHQMQECIK